MELRIKKFLVYTNMYYSKSIKQVLAEIHHFYSVYGTETYEEKCTQLEHGLQCGTLALEWGMDNEFALAAFLHDIGHFLAQEQKLEGFSAFGHANHADLGAEYLKVNGFSERIVTIIREHVPAKRFLAAVREGYEENLSYASKETLKHQGGAMSLAEVELYKRTPALDDILKLRSIDDSGKLSEANPKELSFWIEIAEHELESNRRAIKLGKE